MRRFAKLAPWRSRWWFAVTPVEARQAAAVNPQAYAERDRGLSSGRALTEAVMALQPWARKDFEAAVDRLIAARNISHLEAAAVFELEVGLGGHGGLAGWSADPLRAWRENAAQPGADA